MNVRAVFEMVAQHGGNEASNLSVNVSELYMRNPVNMRCRHDIDLMLTNVTDVDPTLNQYRVNAGKHLFFSLLN